MRYVACVWARSHGGQHWATIVSEDEWDPFAVVKRAFKGSDNPLLTHLRRKSRRVHCPPKSGHNSHKRMKNDVPALQDKDVRRTHEKKIAQRLQNAVAHPEDFFSLHSRMMISTKRRVSQVCNPVFV